MGIDLSGQVKDELQAVQDYTHLVVAARREGKDYTAAVLELIAQDEQRHSVMLEELILHPEGIMPPPHVTVIDPGSTDFQVDDIVSWSAFCQENDRVKKLGGRLALAMAKI